MVTGCNGSQIPLHAWIDGCLCYLQRLTRIVGWDDVGISGGRGEGSSRAMLATARPSLVYCCAASARYVESCA